jgi:hypothetical protein
MNSPFRPRPERFSGDLRLVAAPPAASQARAFVREQIRRWRLDEPTGYDLPGTADLIASELVTNSLKATSAFQISIPRTAPQAAIVVIRLRLAYRSLFIEV